MMTDLPKLASVILDAWLPAIKDHFGDDLISVMVCGGISLGDFMPGWSDVDICVTIGRALTNADAAFIGLHHAEIYKRFVERGEGGWRSGQAIEGSYLSESATVSLERSASFISAGGSGVRLREGPPFQPFDRYILSKSEIRLCGEPFSFVIPSIDELAAHTLDDLRKHDEIDKRADQSGIWFAGMLMWFARSLSFWREGCLLSKTEALRREIEGGSPYSEAYRLALRLRETGSRYCADYRDELRRYYRSMKDPATEELYKIAGRAV